MKLRLTLSSGINDVLVARKVEIASDRQIIAIPNATFRRYHEGGLDASGADQIVEVELPDVDCTYNGVEL